MGLTHTFPGPEALAGADLEADGLSPQQAATVSRFAGSVATHQLHLDAVNPLDAFEKQFDAVPGIQAGVPQYLALRLGYGDAFPCQDPGLRRAWLRLSSQSTTPGASVPGNYWHPYGAFAAMHLWTTFSGKS
jgi:DNA-3-methyladenine glycosylase II